MKKVTLIMLLIYSAASFSHVNTFEYEGSEVENLWVRSFNGQMTLNSGGSKIRISYKLKENNQCRVEEEKDEKNVRLDLVGEEVACVAEVDLQVPENLKYLTLNQEGGDFIIKGIFHKLVVNQSKGKLYFDGNTASFTHNSTGLSDAVVKYVGHPKGRATFNAQSGDILLMLPSQSKISFSSHGFFGGIESKISANSDYDFYIELNHSGADLEIKGY